ncbi:adenosylhomocysteine nucleosidase [Alkalibacillus filiformis]|uniref:Adenosylhomocysteine nucleosidase n=1 Tax=Alkalibacillus filiformis TaxID=200990 RepID=A0ABU0DSH2_9BACI|nr:HAD hydrolase-like protein [Alkalibacillus filiformis]MDQ0351372.1 adenosylhomocysteine nucleosidase [Alkalibacillus filiformis]
MNSKNMIFDMDGTLFQTDKILELALDDTFNDLRLRGLWEGDTPIEQYRSIMGVPLPKVWETLLPNQPESIRLEVDQMFLEKLLVNIRAGNGALYPNVIETLSRLKEQGYSIFIASNGLVDYLNTIVEFYELDRFVTEVFSIEQINSLDKADLVREIVSKFNIQSGVVVGDRLSDIKAAKANGLYSVGCRFDFAQEEELAQADVVIDDIKNVLKKLPADY